MRRPRRSKVASWLWTLDEDVKPTASPISRTVGGYPRSLTVSEMKSRIRRCLGVICSVDACPQPVFPRVMSEPPLSVGKLARGSKEFKHMFGSVLDFERVFGRLSR